MTKCGKSFMPECEYFATNGCVSPFNCPYKVENESITTATSTPCNLYPLETNKDKEISRLKAENAELRARLDKAVELPRVECIMTREWLSREIIGSIMFEWCVLYKKDGYIMAEPCLSKEAAEARLKKLQEKTVYTVIKNCTNCQHYNAGWAECRAPATANFDCESTHGTCFTQDIIDDECKKHLCVAKLEFDLGLLDPITGELKPQYFIDREAAEARLREMQEEI